MNWFEAILNRLQELWPWVRIRPWQAAFRTSYIPFAKARTVVLVGPLIARDIPWFDDTQIRDIQEDTYNLPTQSVTTKDNESVSLSVNFVYEIIDVEKAIVAVKQFDASLQDLAMVFVNTRCRELTWVELRDQQRDLERGIRETLTRQAEKWGVKILRVGITDLVRARQYRFFGDTAFASTV